MTPVMLMLYLLGFLTGFVFACLLFVAASNEDDL
jgi:hypothetical protein